MAFQTSDKAVALGHSKELNGSVGDGSNHISSTCEALCMSAHSAAQDSVPSPALAYHAFPVPGKFATVPSKKLSGSLDLSLAYSPGVAEACQIIQKNPDMASLYTMRQHLVAVISNGTAVLGLGNIGALAAKPVMEGKAVLFQFFSGLNAIDLEINEEDPDKLIDTVVRLAPSFGAINLEDIKAPECFYIERALKERLDIPVFHDDQHGTAITVSAAILNALELVGKTLKTSRCVIAGAGAGALACAGLLCELGLSASNLIVCDTKGVIHEKREDLSSYKRVYARDTHLRSLRDALQGADIFLGLSGPGTVTSDMVEGMAHCPIIFALANPIPEIWPSEVLRVRPDAYVGTGRSDLPNQVNNVLCFPYIFRGAMDAGARSITLEMKKACVGALSALAKEGFVDLEGAYQGEIQNFGPQYFLPKPFDQRLSVSLPLAVAKAAMDTGKVPLFDLDHYRACLVNRAYKDFLVFKNMLARPVKSGQILKLGYDIETEDGKIPHAVCAAARVMKSSGLAEPYFIGDRDRIESQIKADSVLSQLSVYSKAEYRDHILLMGQPLVEKSVSVIRVKSSKHKATERLDLQGEHIQGWLYDGKLHVYSSSAPTDHVKRMLEACQCRLLCSASQDGQGNGSVSSFNPADREGSALGSFDLSAPHFGGLAVKSILDVVWHTDPAPELLGIPWFGPMPYSPNAFPLIYQDDGVRHTIEMSCWTVLMQEISM